MNVSRTAAFASGAIFALVLGSGTAYAATGGDFHLGRHNVANRASTLTSTAGIPLSLEARVGSPPMKVNRSVRIPRLNADLLDSRHESDFALANGGFGTVTATGVGFDGDSNGTSESIVAVATCPAGSHRTGGGFTDQTTGSVLFINTPTGPGSWSVAIETDNVGPAADADLKAQVICYNPRGTVAANARIVTNRAAALAQLPPALRRSVLARVAN